MKKLLFTALIAISLMSSAFATPVKGVTYRMAEAFSTAFKGAENLQWSLTDDYVKASFDLRGIKMEAFYDHSGELIGSSHAITLESLPIQAKRKFAMKYSDYIVKEAIVFEGADESAYFVSAESETRTVIIKITNSTVETFKVIYKN